MSAAGITGEVGSVGASGGNQPDAAAASAAHQQAHAHDPYARSKPTFRGALAALGAPVYPSRPRGPAAGGVSGGSLIRPPFGSGFSGMDSFARHQLLAAEYARYNRGHTAAPQPPAKTDADVLKENYRFVRSAEDDEAALNGSAEQRIAKRYYDRLFKEYAIADMTHYRSGRIGLRWRTESEVLSGRGQFSCGNKHCSTGSTDLNSYELPFEYVESGMTKQALVKVRLCKACAYMLHYPHLKRIEAERKAQAKAIKAEKREKKRAKKAKAKREKKEKKDSKSSKSRSKRKRNDSDSSSSSDSDSSSSDDEGRNPTAAKKSRRDAPSSIEPGTASSSLPSSSVSASSRVAELDPPHATGSSPTPAHPHPAIAPSSVSTSTGDATTDDFFQRYFPHMFP